MSLHDQIRTRIDQFAAEPSDLIRQAALEAVADSLGGRAPRATVAKAAAAPKARPSGGGGKRDPKVIEALVSKVASYVKSHPGKRVEEIAAGIGVSTKDLALPVIKLLASKTIKKTGERRGTKYFPH